MKKWLVFFAVCGLLGWGAYSVYGHRARLVGLFFEPGIEHFLTRLFGTSVKVQGLRFDPVSGDLDCVRFRVMNQPIFSKAPHIDVLKLHGRVNVREIFHHRILIPELTLGKMDYLIERVNHEKDTRANCRMMVWAVKDYVREKRKHEGSRKSGSPPWQVKIDRIVIQDGSFIYDNRITEYKNRVSFKPLHGELVGFEYPTDEKVMSQHMRLEGLMGEEKPVPFIVEGPANFATNNVSFHLKGMIREEGLAAEYGQFWEDLPIRVKGGDFLMNVEGRYREDYLDCLYTVKLKSLKLAPGSSVTEMFLGVPLVGVIKFLESQKEFDLKIPVNGEITDPRFEMSKAFRTAFGEAVRMHTKNSLDMIRAGTAKIAEGTQQVAVKTLQGAATVTDLVAAKTPVLNQVLQRSETKEETTDANA